MCVYIYIYIRIYTPPCDRLSHVSTNKISVCQEVLLWIVVFENVVLRCASIVGWGTMLQTRRSRVRVAIRCFFFNWPNPSSRTMALGSTQPLTEMSTRNLTGGKGRPAGAQGRQAYRHLWADCMKKMWEPRRLTTLWAFTACYRDSFTFLHGIVAFAYASVCFLCWPYLFGL
jgi:hypothetical protein